MGTMKRRVFALLRWVLLGTLIGGAVWYGRENTELIGALRGVSVMAAVTVLALVGIGNLAQGVQFKVLSSVFDLDLSFWEWYGLTVCKGMYGFLMPGRPGTALQAVYLKKMHGFALTDFGSVFAATNLLNATTYAVVGLLACGMEYTVGGRMPVPVLLAGVGCLAFSIGGAVVLALAASSVRFLPGQKLRELGKRVRAGLQLLASRPRVLGRVAMLVAFRNVSGGAALLVAGRAVGLEISFLQGIILASIGSFGTFLPVTPASIGVNEGIIAGVAELLGMAADTAMLAALVKRAASVVLLFTVGSVAQYILTGSLLSPGESVRTTAVTPAEEGQSTSNPDSDERDGL
jgi:uncharacterized membrane protein YbhN (UPF0104 family)